MQQDHLKCSTKKCKFIGPVLYFAFIYNKTLCPKCASKAVEKRKMTNY